MAPRSWSQSAPKSRPSSVRSSASRSASSVGEAVGPVDGERAEPAEVVEADVAEAASVGRGADGRGGPPAEADGGVADPDDPVSEHLLHRLGHQARWVGEVDAPRAGGAVGDATGDVEGDGHGAQGIGDAAGSGRLLAEAARVEGDPLVGDPAGEPADAHRGEDEVAAVERLVEVGRRADLDVPGPVRRVGLLLEGAPEDLEPVGVDVVERDLVDPVRVVVGEEGTVDEGDAEAAATEHRQPHRPSDRTMSLWHRSAQK